VNFAFEVGRRERKRQAVHENLLEAGRELFRTQGIGRTTVDDIAHAVDVARQTFFNHFPYKEALALELGAGRVQTVADGARALLEAGTPALDVLQQIGAWMLDMACDQGELAVVVARELLHPEADRATSAERQMPLQGLFEAILQQAREEGAVRDDLSLQVVATGLSGVVTGMFARVLRAKREDLQTELAICFDMVFNGITDRRR